MLEPFNRDHRVEAVVLEGEPFVHVSVPETFGGDGAKVEQIRVDPFEPGVFEELLEGPGATGDIQQAPRRQVPSQQSVHRLMGS